MRFVAPVAPPPHDPGRQLCASVRFVTRPPIHFPIGLALSASGIGLRVLQVCNLNWINTHDCPLFRGLIFNSFFSPNSHSIFDTWSEAHSLLTCCPFTSASFSSFWLSQPRTRSAFRILTKHTAKRPPQTCDSRTTPMPVLRDSAPSRPPCPTISATSPLARALFPRTKASLTRTIICFRLFRAAAQKSLLPLSQSALRAPSASPRPTVCATCPTFRALPSAPPTMTVLSPA